MDLNKAAAALEAFGFMAYNSSRGLVIHVPDKRKRLRWKEGRQHGYVETLVRAAVVKVAPGSHAIPEWSDTSEQKWMEEPDRVIVEVCDHPLSSRLQPFETAPNSTYSGAWIEAAILLHENGLAAPYEVKER